jgi:hypothetical protein
MKDPFFHVDDVVVHAVVRQWPLVTRKDSLHGISHWLRVARNAAQIATTAFPDDAPSIIPLTGLFALFHDSQRLTEGVDYEHGPLAEKFLRTYALTEDIGIREADVERVALACRVHTTFQPINIGQLDDQRTRMVLACCLDADRLDLLRVGIQPEAQYLYTETAKSLIP